MDDLVWIYSVSLNGMPFNHGSTSGIIIAYICDEKKRNFWLMFDIRINHSFQCGWWVNKNISHFKILCSKQSKFNGIALHLTKMAICAFYCDFSVRCTIFRKLPTKFGFIWFLHHQIKNINRIPDLLSPSNMNWAVWFAV